VKLKNSGIAAKSDLVEEQRTTFVVKTKKLMFTNSVFLYLQIHQHQYLEKEAVHGFPFRLTSAKSSYISREQI
jgi:hypothetical protein